MAQVVSINGFTRCGLLMHINELRHVNNCAYFCTYKCITFFE